MCGFQKLIAPWQSMEESRSSSTLLTGKTLINVELPIVKATVAMNQCYMSDVNGLEAGGIGRSLFLWP